MNKSYIIETELLREKLWNQYIIPIKYSLLKMYPKILGIKEVDSMFVRIVFNKIITRTTNDDPVFITSISKIALTQLQEDFQYFKLNSLAQDIYNQVDKAFNICANIISNDIKQTKVLEDEKFSIESGIIKYKNKEYQEISGLVNIYPDKINYIIALIIRYNYLKLETHGLANNYAKMGYSKSDNVIEAFANPFNKYFDNFCSAFPDLESVFGSMGSFFDQKELINKNSNNDRLTIVCNPIFDVGMIKEMLNRIFILLSNNKNIKYKFVLTLPGWKDFKEIMDLQDVVYTNSFKIIKKKDTEFIDYRNNKIIKPCDILYIEMEN